MVKWGPGTLFFHDNGPPSRSFSNSSNLSYTSLPSNFRHCYNNRYSTVVSKESEAKPGAYTAINVMVVTSYYALIYGISFSAHQNEHLANKSIMLTRKFPPPSPATNTHTHIVIHRRVEKADSTRTEQKQHCVLVESAFSTLP